MPPAVCLSSRLAFGIGGNIILLELSLALPSLGKISEDVSTLEWPSADFKFGCIV